ncbi:pre-mRNA splicing factor cef-1 [Saitoella complicata NRRL Y-17804]|nr:pre-mRNA splicing factor cef-1 [Saitoella complicata NRRL Y-17804]ODQ56066.1 pre-mRNA splicing factor cef-1 [Saitoella complicata NRRL Y-17804]
MAVVKGGVWKNTEDEILKAAISKYGKNQWARISSLLVRKTPKQCKARWYEWLDPAIKKTEWSRDEDEKLLHLAKLMPTQWKTICTIVGRTASQCLERYQQLLDEAEARENSELGFTGSAGAEGVPSAEDVRRLRPGELDPDPETRPAKPDAIDMDEEEKEMLSEARARLANTQGKKAKRKAREKQLEESRRLAVLQKRRELKAAGINTKLHHRAKGQMDYNADIPFEKQPALGFYDTSEEQLRQGKARVNVDLAKLENKRRGEQDEKEKKKRQKRENVEDKRPGEKPLDSALQAGQAQRLRDAEQLSRRRGLVLPAPQVGAQELENIVKIGMASESSRDLVDEDANPATRGLIGEYSTLNSNGPARTPQASAATDNIAVEARNLRAMTQTQSSLLGQANTPLGESVGTGYDGILPRKQTLVTPNPLSTPLPSMPAPNASIAGTTPLRTPRDRLAINGNGQGQDLIGATPRDLRVHHEAAASTLRSALAALPKPKNDFELVMPDVHAVEGSSVDQATPTLEDAEVRDRRIRAQKEASRQAALMRRSQVLQRNLPRPLYVNLDALMSIAGESENDAERLVLQEMATLVAHDAAQYPAPGSNISGTAHVQTDLLDSLMDRARSEIAREHGIHVDPQSSFHDAWHKLHSGSKHVPGSDIYCDVDGEHDVNAVKVKFEKTMRNLSEDADRSHKLEKKLCILLGGYQARSRTLSAKLREAHEAIVQTAIDLGCFQTLWLAERDVIPRRVAVLEEEVNFLARRESEGQTRYRELLEDKSTLLLG